MLRAKRNRTAASAVIMAALTASGCGSSDKEIEIVAPEASIPVMNADPKAPMANINETNEFQHPEALKGSIVTPGK